MCVCCVIRWLLFLFQNKLRFRLIKCGSDENESQRTTVSFRWMEAGAPFYLTLNFLRPNYCYCFGRHCFVDVRAISSLAFFAFFFFLFHTHINCPSLPIVNVVSLMFVFEFSDFFFYSFTVARLNFKPFQPLCTFSTVPICVCHSPKRPTKNKAKRYYYYCF